MNKRHKFEQNKRLQKTQRCLLICTLDGFICLSVGSKVLEISHADLLGLNFFNDVITPYSKLCLDDQFQGQILPASKYQIYFTCEIKRKHKNQHMDCEQSKRCFPKIVSLVYKKIFVHCVRIYVSFDDQKLEQKKIEISYIKDSNIQYKQLISLEICEVLIPEFYEFYEMDPIVQEIVQVRNNQAMDLIKVQQIYDENQDQFHQLKNKQK